MFEELSEKLDSVLGRFRSRGLLTESMIREGLREVRRVLLEADVNFQVAKDFLSRVEEKATGEKVLKSVTFASGPFFRHDAGLRRIAGASLTAESVGPL